MLDRVLAFIGMLGVVAFMGVVAMSVMEPDLWIVSIVVLSIGILYFWKELKPGGDHAEGEKHGESDS